MGGIKQLEAWVRQSGGRALGARFLNFFEIDNLKFQKNLKKIWDVDNDGIYMCAKNQNELLRSLGYVKMTNFQI
jgi:hypothetical protein